RRGRRRTAAWPARDPRSPRRGSPRRAPCGDANPLRRDGVPVRVHDVPDAADALTVGVALGLVARERVQQVVVVGELVGVVEREQLLVEALARDRLGRRALRPDLLAATGALARARVGAVGVERVQRVALGVDEDLVERRRAQLHRRLLLFLLLRLLLVAAGRGTGVLSRGGERGGLGG